MSENNTKPTNKYFAAANTYQGFRSYFDLIFDSSEYEYIYVLKGGPGTGKSSLMRRVVDYFAERHLITEEIYCSSDPHSLDGVIISDKNKRVAIIDGTAPHERDAKIPCATDEIINLAEGLDKRWISSKKNDIISITLEKSKAYKTAYDYLSLAGKSAGVILRTYIDSFNIFEAKGKAEMILDDITTSNKAKSSTRLLSSFSRYGRYAIGVPSNQNQRIIRVGGSEEAGSLFMKTLYEIIGFNKYNLIHFPAALDPSLTEAVYFHDSNTFITTDDTGDINADEFVRLPPLDAERIKAATIIKKDAINEAKRWFAIASDLHFRLEKIYGEAMNFDVNNRICEDLVTKIANILEITI